METEKKIFLRDVNDRDVQTAIAGISTSWEARAALTHSLHRLNKDAVERMLSLIDNSEDASLTLKYANYSGFSEAQIEKLLSMIDNSEDAALVVGLNYPILNQKQIGKLLSLIDKKLDAEFVLRFAAYVLSPEDKVELSKFK